MLSERLAWYVAGPLIGMFIVGLRATLNRPFGALGGYIELSEKGPFSAGLGVRGYLLFGLVLGGFLYALVSGVLAPSLSYAEGSALLAGTRAGQVAILFAAGLAMGYGARTAGGCTSGHGMSGMSLLSPASIVATMAFFATAVALANLLQALLGGGP